MARPGMTKQMWAAYAMYHKDCKEMQDIAKEFGQVRQTISKWIKLCEEEIESVPEYRAGQPYAVDMYRLATQNIYDAIARGDTRVALEVWKRPFLIIPPDMPSDYGSLNTQQLVESLISGLLQLEGVRLLEAVKDKLNGQDKGNGNGSDNGMEIPYDGSHERSAQEEEGGEAEGVVSIDTSVQ